MIFCRITFQNGRSNFRIQISTLEFLTLTTLEIMKKTKKENPLSSLHTLAFLKSYVKINITCLVK